MLASNNGYRVSILRLQVKSTILKNNPFAATAGAEFKCGEGGGALYGKWSNNLELQNH